MIWRAVLRYLMIPRNHKLYRKFHNFLMHLSCDIYVCLTLDTNKFVKQVLVIFFSALILSSSGGLVLAKHFCGGELVETAVFEDLHACCGEETEMPSGCCDFEHEILKHDDNTQISFASLDPPEQILLHTIEYPSFVQTIIQSTFVDNTYLLRSLTVPDRLARYQSFLL